jgi:hypothetical protein
VQAAQPASTYALRPQTIIGLHKTKSGTYSLVQMNRVFARDDVSDGAAGGLAGGLLAAVLACVGHFCARLLAQFTQR